VLNNKGRMSKQTADKVHRIIAENGGAPASRQPAGTIVFGSVDPYIKVHHSHVHLQLLEGMQSVLNQHKWSLVMRDFDSPEQFRRETGDYSAAVLVGFPEQPELWADRSGIPIVWALRSTAADADVVQEDNREIARLAGQYLADRGHRTVGYINDIHVETLAERQLHLGLYLKERGVGLVVASGDKIFNEAGDGPVIDRDQVARAVKKLLSAKPKPTAMFVPGDGLSVIVYAVLAELGYQPGRDLDIVSCNNEQPYLSLLDPRPATIGMRCDAIGRRAAETALWRVGHPDEPTVRLLVSPHLVLPKS
ncbi:MAG: LacI family transcriptional regulator, partial [Planctomycetes bacterium]|nr:LacI family transcriptional regulator [Planctomycetota bacterium]